jgi:hypothetical protein
MTNDPIVTPDYQTAKPFPCAILDGLAFFPRELIANASDDAAEWERNGFGCLIEDALECRRLVAILTDERTPLGLLLGEMLSGDWLAFLRQLTGIAELIDCSQGGFLSIVPSGGRLALHRDQAKTGMGFEARGLSLCLFLTHRWEDEWGGHLELWSECGGRPTWCARRIRPQFGRIVLFDPQGYHGFPDPITCPEPVCRLSLELSYYAPARPGATRTHPWFSLRPGEDHDRILNDFRLLSRRTG